MTGWHVSKTDKTYSLPRQSAQESEYSADVGCSETDETYSPTQSGQSPDFDVEYRRTS